MNVFDLLLKKKPNGENKGLFNLIIILCIGVILLLVSNLFTEKPEKKQIVSSNTDQSTSLDHTGVYDYEKKLEVRLEEILSKIEGVGKVQVMITIQSGKEIVINKDTPFDESEITEEGAQTGEKTNYEKSIDEKTVLVNDSDGSTQPIILKEEEPTIKGVLIIAQGGDRAEIKDRLIKSTQVLLDLPVHKIQVQKMES